MHENLICAVGVVGVVVSVVSIVADVIINRGCMRNMMLECVA